MRLVAVGRPLEVVGFALAGVETVSCGTEEAAEQTIGRLATASPSVGLVIVSAWAGRAAHRAIARVRDRKGPPVIVALPSDPEAAS